MEEREEREDLIEGRNAVQEALRAGRTIDKLFIARGETDRTLARIAAKAREKGIVVTECDRRKLDAMSTTKAHQGVIAQAAVREYCELDDMLALAAERGEEPFLIVCDEIADPHNLGAILRTAEAAGAHGVIVPKRRAAGLTWTVGKASAGALEYVPVARVANIAQCVEDLKKRGVWVCAADMDGQSWCGADLTGPIALVIGGEDSGVSRVVRDKCDFILSLPMNGSINSLNASCACAIVLYEIARQRAGIPANNRFGGK